MEKNNIAIDLDGVVWDVHSVLIEIYNKKYNGNITVEDIDRWSFFPFDIFWAIYPIACKRINKYRYIDEKLDYYINTLNRFYDVYFLTHGNYTKKGIEKKLKTWGIKKGKSYIDIIIENVSRPKVEYDFDYFIDDNPNMIKEIQKYPEKRLLLFSSPWNKSTIANGYKNVYRMDNWAEVFDFLMKRKEEN